MSTPSLQARKRQISLLLPPDLLRFANEQAKARFVTRNQYLQDLLTQAFEQAQRSES